MSRTNEQWVRRSTCVVSFWFELLTFVSALPSAPPPSPWKNTAQPTKSSVAAFPISVATAV